MEYVPHTKCRFKLIIAGGSGGQTATEAEAVNIGALEAEMGVREIRSGSNVSTARKEETAKQIARLRVDFHAGHPGWDEIVKWWDEVNDLGKPLEKRGIDLIIQDDQGKEIQKIKLERAWPVKFGIQGASKENESAAIVEYLEFISEKFSVGAKSSVRAQNATDGKSAIEISAFKNAKFSNTNKFQVADKINLGSGAVAVGAHNRGSINVGSPLSSAVGSAAGAIASAVVKNSLSGPEIKSSMNQNQNNSTHVVNNDSDSHAGNTSKTTNTNGDSVADSSSTTHDNSNQMNQSSTQVNQDSTLAASSNQNSVPAASSAALGSAAAVGTAAGLAAASASLKNMPDSSKSESGFGTDTVSHSNPNAKAGVKSISIDSTDSKPADLNSEKLKDRGSKESHAGQEKLSTIASSVLAATAIADKIRRGSSGSSFEIPSIGGTETKDEKGPKESQVGQKRQNKSNKKGTSHSQQCSENTENKRTLEKADSATRQVLSSEPGLNGHGSSALVESSSVLETTNSPHSTGAQESKSAYESKGSSGTPKKVFVRNSAKAVPEICLLSSEGSRIVDLEKIRNLIEGPLGGFIQKENLESGLGEISARIQGKKLTIMFLHEEATFDCLDFDLRNNVFALLKATFETDAASNQALH